MRPVLKIGKVLAIVGESKSLRAKCPSEGTGQAILAFLQVTGAYAARHSKLLFLGSGPHWLRIGWRLVHDAAWPWYGRLGRPVDGCRSLLPSPVLVHLLATFLAIWPVPLQIHRCFRGERSAPALMLLAQLLLGRTGSGLGTHGIASASVVGCQADHVLLLSGANLRSNPLHAFIRVSARCKLMSLTKTLDVI